MTALLVMLSVSVATAETAKNLLFYGNSFTIATGFGSSRSVPDVVKAIANAAGRPAPNVVNPSVAGWTLQQHLTSNTGTINSGIAAGQNWDAVILQDYSTQPTHIGSVAEHRSSYLAMYQLVKARSPSAVAIGYETWARGPGHEYYSGNPPTFANPAAMQSELRAGYALSTADVNALYGPGTSTVAPAGDAWERANFPLNFYASDIYHASNRGTLLNAMVLYGTIYNDPTIRDINMPSLLLTLGISTTDAQTLAGFAESVLPEPASLAVLSFVGISLCTRRR
jgi:hypothetical protein